MGLFVSFDSIFFPSFISFICLFVRSFACSFFHLEVRGQLAGADSLRLLCGTLGLELRSPGLSVNALTH